MRVLITGASGFVGGYAVRAFRAMAPGAEIIGATRFGEPARDVDTTVALDLADGGAVEAAIARLRPSHVLNLAAIAAPQAANADPATAWMTNAMGAMALGRALLAHAAGAALLQAGSGASYGLTAGSGMPALSEDAAFAPLDEYAASKAAADLGLGALAGQGLRVVRLRPFNHTGPGQGTDYAVPSFAAQIAAIERGEQPPVLDVGDLEAQRDYCDVADIAEAYAMAALALDADRIKPGRAYNLCSGGAVSMRSVLETLLSLSAVPIEIRQDEARLRPSQIPRLVGDPARAQRELGWRAATPLRDTLGATLRFFRDGGVSSP